MIFAPRLIILLSLCFLFMGLRVKPLTPVTCDITVKVTAIRNKSGRLQIQIYRDQKTFLKETPWKVYHVSKKDVKDHYLIYTIEGLSPGTYGLALLDDENSNSKMDYGLVMPKEGFGFSDYYHTSWSRPVFDDFKFQLTEDRKVKIQIRYV
jgi:uncharacterized protein (DUF2141 family)